jgi:hypothetical protein
MHPNPAGHQVIADRLSAFFKDALAGRGGRPLPSARAAENRRKADEALAGLRFRVHAVCDGATPLSAAKPPWSPVPRELESLMRVEDGALCFSNLAAETRRPLSFTLNLPAKEGAQALTFTARTTARSQEAPYLSFGDGRTKVWAWVFADRFVVSRHDATKDRIEVRLDGTAYRQYRLVLNGMDLYVFVDDMTKPARVAPGWLVPGWREGRYAQLGLGVGGKACECQWRGIEVAFAEP